MPLSLGQMHPSMEHYAGQVPHNRLRKTPLGGEGVADSMSRTPTIIKLLGSDLLPISAGLRPAERMFLSRILSCHPGRGRQAETRDPSKSWRGRRDGSRL